MSGTPGVADRDATGLEVADDERAKAKHAILAPGTTRTTQSGSVNCKCWRSPNCPASGVQGRSAGCRTRGAWLRYESGEDGNGAPAARAASRAAPTAGLAATRAFLGRAWRLPSIRFPGQRMTRPLTHFGPSADAMTNDPCGVAAAQKKFPCAPPRRSRMFRLAFRFADPYSSGACGCAVALRNERLVERYRPRCRAWNRRCCSMKLAMKK